MVRCFLIPILQFFLSLTLAAVEEVKLKHTRYTLEHVRAFGMYNYLHLDPWYEESVLFVDSKGRVLCLTVTLVSCYVLRLPLKTLERHERLLCTSKMKKKKKNLLFFFAVGFLPSVSLFYFMLQGRDTIGC